MLLDFEFLVDEETGELINAEEFDNLNIIFSTKIEDCALHFRTLLSEAEAYKKEEKYFAERSDTTLRHAEKIKKYIDYSLKGEKFKSTRVNISYRKSDKLHITDDSNIPSCYFKELKPAVKVQELKTAIKNGLVVEGAEIITNNNIQIK